MSTATYSSIPTTNDGLNGLVSSEPSSAAASIPQSLTLNGSTHISSAPRPLLEASVINGHIVNPITADSPGIKLVLNPQQYDSSNLTSPNGTSTAPNIRSPTNEAEARAAEMSNITNLSTTSSNLGSSSTSKPDDALIKALTDAKDRIFVLRMADSMESIINQRSAKQPNPRTTIQCINSYQRALVYRCATYYKVTVEPDQTVIHAFATTESRIPPVRIAEVVPAEQNTPANKPMVKIMRRAGADAGKASSVSPSPSHGRSAASSTTSLLESSATGGTSIPSSSNSTDKVEGSGDPSSVVDGGSELTEPSEGKRDDQTEMLIKLGLGVAPSSSTENKPKISASQRKTLEERAADYAAARSRIFEGFSESQDNASFSSGGGPSEVTDNGNEGIKPPVINAEEDLSNAMSRMRMNGRTDGNGRRNGPQSGKSAPSYANINSRPSTSGSSGSQDGEWDRGEAASFTFPTLYDPDAPSNPPNQPDYEANPPQQTSHPSQTHYIDHTGQHHYSQNAGYPTQPFAPYPPYGVSYQNQYPPPQPMNPVPSSHPPPVANYPPMQYSYYQPGMPPPPGAYSSWPGYGSVPVDHSGQQPPPIPPQMVDPSRGPAVAQAPLPQQPNNHMMGAYSAILSGPQQQPFWPGQIHPPPIPPQNNVPGPMPNPAYSRGGPMSPYSPNVYSPASPHQAPLPPIQSNTTGPQGGGRQLWSPTQSARPLQSTRDGGTPGRNGNFNGNQSRMGGRSNTGSASSSRSASRTGGNRYSDRLLDPGLTASPMSGGTMSPGTNGGRHGGGGRTTSMSSSGSGRVGGLARNPLSFAGSPGSGSITLPPIVMSKDGVTYALDRQHSGGPKSSRSSRSAASTGGGSGTHTPLDETASVASVSSTSSNSSSRTFTSTSSKHPSLPPRPDWAVGMTPGGTPGSGHPRSSSSSSSSHSRTHSASRPASHHGGPALHPTDFPPLPGGAALGSQMRVGPMARGTPSGVWNNSRTLMPPPSLRSNHSHNSNGSDVFQGSQSLDGSDKPSVGFSSFKQSEQTLSSPVSIMDPTERADLISSSILADKSPYTASSTNLQGNAD